MKHPQIVVFETDGLIARYLEETGARRGWWLRTEDDPRLTPEHADRKNWLLRESRQMPSCLNLLRTGGPGLLIVKLGRNLSRELTVLDEVHAALPDVPVVVVGDTEDDAMRILAYDLGASYVLQPPEPRARLVELVECLANASVERMKETRFESPPAEAKVRISTDA